MKNVRCILCVHYDVCCRYNPQIKEYNKEKCEDYENRDNYIHLLTNAGDFVYIIIDDEIKKALVCSVDIESTQDETYIQYNVVIDHTVILKHYCTPFDLNIKFFLTEENALIKLKETNLNEN